MKTITVINTPKVPVSNENFTYNYYSEQEKFIDDRKFIIFEGEEESYSIRNSNALSLTPPRFVSFNLELFNIHEYNLYEMLENNGTLAATPAITNKLQILENIGNSKRNLFDLKKRRKYFNDVSYLKRNQISDGEIDLTLAEDASEPYKQLVKFFDEENPDNVLPVGPNQDYINYAINAQNINNYTSFNQDQKDGDFTIIDRSIFRRVKNSNKKIIHSYLEDKQSESNKNFFNIVKQNDIPSIIEREEIFQESINQSEVEIVNAGLNAIRNPASLFEVPRQEETIVDIVTDNLDAILENEELSQRQVFSVKPKILVKTFDEIEGEIGGSFKELNEFVVGVLIDKYHLVNNNKKYLCSKFFKVIPQKNATLNASQVKDTAVKYGRTYIYEVRPVLMQSFVQEAKQPTRNNYLILGRRTSSFAIKCVERESPLPPSHLELEYDFNNKGILLKWGLPRNKQRDIVNFQIFRRESPNKPFKLLKEYRKLNINVVDNSLTGLETPDQTALEKVDFMKFRYLDKNIENNKIYIYAVCCVDAHGLSSALSTQPAGRFNGLTSNLEVDTISLAGALKQYPNQLFPRKTKFYDFENDVISNTPIIKNKSKMNVFFTPDYKTIKRENKSIKIINSNVEQNFANINYFSISLTDINTLKTAKQNIYIYDRES